MDSGAHLICLPCLFPSQAQDLVTGPTPQRLLAQAAQLGVAARAKPLPDLSRLTRLTALNMADNNLLEVPPCLLKLTGLEVLDLSGALHYEPARQTQFLPA